ncbi:hypothetical protein [Actinomadura fibrosa]|uniref:Uncharacterized protein n=1 Tax=Actinomadura fibrosa TaxID=111802 RepID=A0ABW2XNS0_9ACTN|nr:hypothetical protein [Actinomadura fibrosa]
MTVSWPMRTAWKASNAVIGASAGLSKSSAARSTSKSTGAGTCSSDVGTSSRAVGLANTSLRALRTRKIDPRLGRQRRQHLVAADLPSRLV